MVSGLHPVSNTPIQIEVCKMNSFGRQLDHEKESEFRRSLVDFSHRIDHLDGLSRWNHEAHGLRPFDYGMETDHGYFSTDESRRVGNGIFKV